MLWMGQPKLLMDLVDEHRVTLIYHDAVFGVDGRIFEELFLESIHGQPFNGDPWVCQGLLLCEHLLVMTHQITVGQHQPQRDRLLSLFWQKIHRHDVSHLEKASAFTRTAAPAYIGKTVLHRAQERSNHREDGLLILHWSGCGLIKEAVHDGWPCITQQFGNIRVGICQHALVLGRRKTRINRIVAKKDLWPL